MNLEIYSIKQSDFRRKQYKANIFYYICTKIT